jgi:hypothetical protein
MNGPQDRRERPGHVQHAEVVDLHLTPGGIGVVGQHQPLVGERAGVVDQQVHVRAAGRRGLHQGQVGHV